MRAQYRAIARVEKTHGKRGEVVAVPVHGLPPLLHAGISVAVVPPPLKGQRWHEVTSVTGAGASGQLVRLSGVDSIADADALVGKILLARRDELPQDLALHDVDALLGREVSDEEHGFMGSIREVMTGGAQDVWVIDGPYGEVLLPVVDEFVISVEEGAAIRVRVPQGSIPDQGE